MSKNLIGSNGQKMMIPINRSFVSLRVQEFATRMGSRLEKRSRLDFHRRQYTVMETQERGEKKKLKIISAVAEDSKASLPRDSPTWSNMIRIVSIDREIRIVQLGMIDHQSLSTRDHLTEYSSREVKCVTTSFPRPHSLHL